MERFLMVFSLFIIALMQIIIRVIDIFFILFVFIGAIFLKEETFLRITNKIYDELND